jgi:hypothetical protein
MRQLPGHLFRISVLLPLLLLPLAGIFASDFKREVVYQIITDRFFDGSAANNNPAQGAGLYDATKTNWRAYWGAGIWLAFNSRCLISRAWG